MCAPKELYTTARSLLDKNVRVVEMSMDDSWFRDTAAIFVKEAKEAGLPMLPYQAGFFLSIPSPDSGRVCALLQKKHIYLVPLRAGVRVAVCAIPKAKMHGLAGAIRDAMVEAGQL